MFFPFGPISQVQQDEFKQRYNQHVNLALKIRHLPALDSIPIPHVVQAFQELLENEFFPLKAQCFIDYFEDT